MHRTARQIASATALREGDFERACAFAEAAIAADPLDEEAYRARMLALYRAGESGKALAAYEELRRVLGDELGADPSKESESLYLSILRGEDLGAGSAPAPSPQPSEHAAVGRDRELRILQEAWQSARTGGPLLALLMGEPGIGKTHISVTFASSLEATGVLVLRSRCFAVERSLFLQPLADALRPTLLQWPEVLSELDHDEQSMLAELVPEVRPLLDIPSERERASPEAERRLTFRALGNLLGALARRRPVLFVLDDLHLASESTLAFLHSFVRRPRGESVLVLGAVISGEEDAIGPLLGLAPVVTVGPLPQGAVAKLASEAGLGQEADRIYRMTGGHALYVVEAIRAARQATVPESLREAIIGRVRDAGADVAEFLRAAAVAGATFDLDIVEALLECGQARAARLGEESLRRGFLHDAGDRYQFAHEILREILSDSIPGPTRTSWHRRIAGLLKQQGEPDEVVGFHAARGSDWSLACVSYLAAGRRAGRSFANRDAEALLSEAVGAASRLGAATQMAEARLERGRLRMTLGEYEGAEEDLGTALGLARACGDRALEAVILEQLAWNSYFARRLNEAADRAATATRADSGVGVEALRARVHVALGNLELGEREARHAQAAALAVGDRTHAVVAANTLALAVTHQDRYDDAIRFAHEAEEAARSAGLSREILSGAFARALALGNRGDLPQALEAFNLLLTEGERFDTLIFDARARNGLAWMALELGDPARALDLAQEAFENAVGGPREQDEPQANALLLEADALLRTGQPDRAARALERAEPIGLGAAYGRRFQLRALELGGRIQQAMGVDLLNVATRLVVQARGMGARKYEALGLAMQGHRQDAAALAAAVGSDLLLAKVAPQPEALRAVDRVAEGLPADLRERFAQRWQRELSEPSRAQQEVRPPDP